MRHFATCARRWWPEPEKEKSAEKKKRAKLRRAKKMSCDLDHARVSPHSETLLLGNIMTYQLKSSKDVSVLGKLYELCGTEWAGPISAQQFGSAVAEAYKYTDQPEGFWFEDETGNVICTATVKHIPGLYKAPDKSNAISSVPDPGVFGVRLVTLLHFGYVFTAKEYRGKGLASQMITQVIEHVENDIIDHHVRSSDDKNDSFKNMAVTDGEVDRQLANYYLGKEYFWVLYSGAGTFYEKFGFKSYPLDYYDIPTSIIDEGQRLLLHGLMFGEDDARVVGKKLRMLHQSNPQDVELVQFILQNKELEIVTELNKMLFHSELAGNHKSSSSLTNMTNVLQMSKIGLHPALSSITEMSTAGTGHQAPSSGQRRRSSIVQQSVPKVALKPELNNIQHLWTLSSHAAEISGDEEVIKFDDMMGAIFTNELQQKSHYVIWSTIKQSQLVILAMGELKFYHFGALGGTHGRRGSSFTGLNDLGGYNFQDLDILISVACIVAQKRKLSELSHILASVNDLPAGYPAPILHDYFLNYLPKAFENVHGAEDDADASKQVRFITDAANEIKILPMMRRFGKTSPKFDLDWVSSGMRSWS